MIKRLIGFALGQPLFVILGLFVFVGGGLIAFKNLPVEAFPDVTDTQVTVIALFPGRAAEEVEKQVTIPLEVAMSGMPNAVRLFSHTQFGLSYLVITFNDSAGDYFSRQLVAERLRNVDLPDGVHPDMAPLTSAISEIFRYRVQADNLSSRELRTIEDWVMERELKTVPGVADIVSFGGLVKTYEVQPDLSRMRHFKVTLQQLTAALGRSNANAGGGYIEHGRQQFLIRGIGLLRSAADVENVVVAQNKGVPVLVRDIARVGIGALQRQGQAGENDNDDIVYGVVLMRKGENPTLVLEALKNKIAQINRSGLPPGVKIVPFYDRTWLIDRTLKTVFTNLLEGALLVCVVLYLFLSNARAAAIVAAVIPLALLGTFLGLNFVGIPANLLSLGAMDFGIIVDGAVIVVEHIFQQLSRLSADSTRTERMETVLRAATEVGRPTFFSMVIIIAAHIPIFTLQRQEGRIFAPMAYSVTSALIASLLVSLTLVPLLSLWLLGGRKLTQGENRLLRACKAVYAPALTWALGHGKALFAVAAVALVASGIAASRLGTEFLPELNEGSVWVNVQLEPSVSMAEAALQVRHLRDLLRRTPEVQSVISKLGRPEDGTDPKLSSQVEALVVLRPEENWRTGITKKAILAEMDAAVDAIPGLEVSFSQPIRDNVLESISQVDGQIVVKVVGDDLTKINAIGHTIIGEVRGVAGVSKAFIDREGQLPQYRIEIDRARAARYGLNVGDIEDVIETALAGKETTSIWEEERRFSVMVRLDESQRASPRLEQLTVATPDGAFIPLSQVADFRVASGAMDIARENGRRVLSIGIFIAGRDMGSVVRDMQQRVNKAVSLPAGYQIVWSGEFENQERAMNRLAWVVPLSIFIIFVLLFDAFKSLKDATLIIANIPFAMIGGVLALLLSGIPLSVSAAIGFIALFGQAVLNGVVMLSHFGRLRERGAKVYDAVYKGSLDRLRTVIMTALLAMLGLLPMALSHAIGSETQRPLAIVVIGGLVSATLLTLLVLPALYLWAHRRDEQPSEQRKQGIP
jgi:cobalt-zinc-cadmium resistance protein CzcA